MKLKGKGKSLIKVVALLLCLCMMIPTYQVKASTSFPSKAVYYNGHTYYAYKVTSSISWKKAEISCENKGGHLVDIQSAGEKKFIEEFVIKKGITTWIGTYYSYSDYQWHYSDGSVAKYLPFNLENSQIKGYMAIYSYNDYIVTASPSSCKYYICEWDSTPYPTLPPKVTSVKATKSGTNAVLTWKKASGVSGYTVYMKTGKNGKFTKIGSTKDTSYIKSKLKKGTTYYFQVRAYKTIYGEKTYGDLSNIITLKM